MRLQTPGRPTPTCSPRLEAGLPHLVLQLLVLCRDGLADGDEAPHGHVHRLAHPVYGRQGALRLLWLVLVVDQGCYLGEQEEKQRRGFNDEGIKRKKKLQLLVISLNS